MDKREEVWLVGLRQMQASLEAVGHVPQRRPWSRYELAPVTAPAATNPCRLYSHIGSPVPIRTQLHHRFPQYLQERIWNEVRFDDGEWMMYLCGLCHDGVHEWLSFILGEGRKPNPFIRGNMYTEAMWAANEYRRALEAAA